MTSITQLLVDSADQMSEEESFVILGSSPMPSLRSNGHSLLNEALNDESQSNEDQLGPVTNLEISSDTAVPEASQANDNMENSTSNANGSVTNILNIEPNPLAASFIMGEINPDALKNSVYSQFPSLCSMQACAEDVVKLQNMMTEYIALKQTLDKVNYTMQQYYKITQKWREESGKREEEYKEQLKECKARIDQLSEENRKLNSDINTNLEQIRLVEDIRQKEHDELRQSVSEKTALINNMRVEMDKLTQQQLKSFDYVTDEEKEQIKDPIDYIKRDEHELAVKELEQKMSKLLAENLDFKDQQKIYIDEINCLKVTSLSSEELLKETRATVAELTAKDAQKQENIEHLQSQIDIYKRDFNLERADREKNAGEKEQYLQDLRALQRRNQELIEALAESHRQGVGKGESSTQSSSLRDNQRPIRILDPTGAAAKTTEISLRCPICSKSYNSLNLLQSHVNDCLDKN